MAALTSLLLLAASLQTAPNFDQKVTFAEKAMSIQKAIGILAKQTGVPLEPSGSLPEWRIYMHCTDQPLKDVMEKLGDTLYAEWVSDQGKYFLRTSSKKLNAARQAQISLNVAKLQKEINKRLKDAATAPPMTREKAEEIAKKIRDFSNTEGQDWKEYSKLQALDPSKTFIWQLLSQCNLREVAAIKPGERIVFALTPTPLQRPLDRAYVMSKLPAFLNGFIEWNLATQNSDEDESQNQEPEQVKSMQEYRLQQEQKLRAFQCNELLLTVTLDKENPSYHLALAMFDPKGDKAGNDFSQEYFSLAEDQEEQADMVKNAAPKEGEKKLELSQGEKDFGKMLMGAFDFGGRGGPKDPIKPEWRERMSNPDRFEPLSYGMTEVMDAYTAENGGQTLMVMPDIMVFMSGFAEIPGGPGDKMSATGLIRSMQGFLSLNQHKSGNWAIVNSTDVDGAIWGSRPRKELTKLFSSLNDPNTADDVWQNYTAQMEGMPFYDMGYLFGSILTGQSPDFGMDRQNSMAPIYYALSIDQKTHLRSGMPIAVGSLTPAQKEKVRQLTYGAKSLYKCMSPEWVGREQSMTAEQREQNADYLYQNGGSSLFLQNLRDEPTFSLPNGLPDQGQIVAKPSSKQVVAVFDNPEGTGFSYDQETYAIAWDVFQHERPELFPGETRRLASYYRLGQKQVLRMRVDFDKTRALYGSVELKVSGKKDKPVTFEKLPESVKKEVLEQVKQYRESYKDAKPGQFGGGRGSIPKP